MDDRTKLVNEIERLEAEKSRIERQLCQQLDELDKKKMMYSSALSFLERGDACECDAEVERIAEAVDLTTCETVEERARAIALCTEDGVVRPKLVAAVLKQKGVGNDNKYLSAYVSKRIRNSPYWEKLRHGVYLFRGHPAHEGGVNE